MRENWKSITEERVESGGVITVMESEKLKFEEFSRQMMPTKNEDFISVINHSYDKICPSSREINLEWERYADLSHGKIYEEMRERIAKKKLAKLKPSKVPPISQDSL